MKNDNKNKRKIPAWFFVLGVFQCIIRKIYFFPVWLIFIGYGIVSKDFILANIFLLIWFIIAIIEEIRIVSTMQSDSSNPEFNKIMDTVFNENGFQMDAFEDMISEKLGNNEEENVDEEETVDKEEISINNEGDNEYEK